MHRQNKEDSFGLGLSPHPIMEDGNTMAAFRDAPTGTMASTNAENESRISVTVADGSIIQYTMRGLTENEIATWAHFCASVFSYKANPPPCSYFEHHFYHDPARDASLIRVMVYEGQVVSSCRIFQRQVSVGGGASLFAGGIGEVCTSPQHRKRGLSKMLLLNAIHIMKDRGMKLSLLHSAPAFFPVYEKSGGYGCIESMWSVVTVARSKLNDTSRLYVVRQAQFPSDTLRMQQIHQQYSERRFVGCIVRSEEYWNEYICKELEGSLWALTRNDDVVAWLSLRLRGERFQMRDFGCDTGLIAVSEALSMLLKVALQEKTNDESVSLHLPTTVIEDMKPSQATFLDMKTVVAENDYGWMYRTLQTGELSMVEAAKTSNHFIWPADSF